MKHTMTEYECPVCKKGLVVEEEPPGIIHKYDDCVERMVEIDSSGTETKSSDYEADR